LEELEEKQRAGCSDVAVIEVFPAQKYRTSELRIKSAGTQYYRTSKWLCRSWFIRRD